MTLGYFGPTATAPVVRVCLDAYYRMRDAADSMRAEMLAAGAPLAERIAMACVYDDINQGIASAHRWLSRAARCGVGAGPSPAQKGHGCPAPLSAVGSAPSMLPSADITVPANSLFCAHPVQELPFLPEASHTPSTGDQK